MEHGPDVRSTLMGPEMQNAPWLSNESQKQIEDLLRARWSVADIYDLHC